MYAYRAFPFPWQPKLSAILLNSSQNMATSETPWTADYAGSKYFNRLSISDKRRYLEKTKEIGDPYGYSLNSVESEDFPDIRSHDIFNYLVLSTSFCSTDRFKAYKTMDAYKYFASGFVSFVGSKKVSKYFVVVGKACTKVDE